MCEKSSTSRAPTSPLKRAAYGNTTSPVVRIAPSRSSSLSSVVSRTMITSLRLLCITWEYSGSAITWPCAFMMPKYPSSQKAMQSFNQNRILLALADISYYSTHNVIYYLIISFILTRAAIQSSRFEKAENRTNPSPHLPKPTPGVQTT